MTDAFSLSGKFALVTGAASGIGVGIATVLAEAGAFVVVADINADGAKAQADALIMAGHKAESVIIDLADEASIVAACAAVISRHGAPWLLFNNAGIQDRQLLLYETAEGWDRTHAVNARGPFLMTREIGRAMVAGGKGGRIVNIASATLWGMMVKGGGAYTASKGSIAALTKVAALELAEYGITVNTVLPGGVITPGSIGAQGPRATGPGTRKAIFGMAEPKDIGGAVLYFATPAARYVTNQSLSVDAGFSIS